MHAVNVSAVALVLAMFGLLLNAVVWLYTGHPWAAGGWVLLTFAAWHFRAWAIN